MININKDIKERFFYRGIQKIPGLNIAQYLNLRNIVFIVNPKVASSSIIFSMVKDYLGKDNVSNKDFYDHVLYSSKKRLSKKCLQTSFNFAVTRDPFSRLYSCYKQKVLLDDEPRITKNYFFQYYPFIKNEQSFEEFVKAVCLIPDIVAEKHFMSQSRILGYPNNRFNIMKMYKISELSGLEEDLKETFSPSFQLEKRNITNTNKLSLTEIYNKDLLNIVYKRFEADFINFDYSEIYSELMDIL